LFRVVPNDAVRPGGAVLTAASGDVVHAEPFEAVELRVDVVFGDADDEE